MTQENEYRDYIQQHQENILKLWSCAKPDLGLTAIDNFTLDDLIAKHDHSKYEPIEFDGYRQHFYPCDADIDIDIEESFAYAINHHYKANLHHWEYWVTAHGVALQMPTVYLIEMLLDWGAMSLTYGKLPGQFFIQQEGRFILHPETKKRVIALLPDIDKLVKNVLS